MINVPEKIYRRLSMLQIKLTQGLRHNAGLNPKAFRYAVYSSYMNTCTYHVHLHTYTGSLIAHEHNFLLYSCFLVH